jgi:hypothetical protein
MYKKEELAVIGAKAALVAGFVALPDLALTAQQALSCWIPGYCNGPASCAGFDNEWVGDCTVRCEYTGGVGYAICSGT